MTPEETRQQAHSEGLTLLVSEANKTGYFGVNLSWVGQPKPYKAQVKRGGKSAHLGEAALLPPRFSAASSAEGSFATALHLERRAASPPPRRRHCASRARRRARRWRRRGMLQRRCR